MSQSNGNGNGHEPQPSTCADAIAKWQIWQKNCDHPKNATVMRIADCLYRETVCLACGHVWSSKKVDLSEIQPSLYVNEMRVKIGPKEEEQDVSSTSVSGTQAD